MDKSAFSPPETLRYRHEEGERADVERELALFDMK